MSNATPLDYAARCERYARQAGWAYDPHELSIGHLTPRQRRRAMHKERRQYGDAPSVVRARRQRHRQSEQQAARQRKRTAAGWGEHDYSGGYSGYGDGQPDIDYFDDGPADPLWEISYPEEHYCVTPGCDCCGDGDG